MASVHNLSADLRHLLDAEEVPLVVQAKIAATGFKTLKLFALMAESRAEVKAFAKSALEIDGEAEVASRLKVTQVVGAWLAASDRLAKRTEMESQARAANLPKLLPKQDHRALRAAFSAKWFPLADRVAPSTHLVELLDEMLEEGEQRPVSLKEVTNIETAEGEEPIQAVVSKDNVIRVKKGRMELQPPASGEDLRRRLRTLGYAYCYLRLKHASTQWLQTCEPWIWDAYADYLLGEEVFELRAMDSDGRVVSTPGLDSVLAYDFQVRKLSARLVNDGSDLAGALRDGYRDVVIKERFFTTPVARMALAPARRPARSRSPVRQVAGAKSKAVAKKPAKGSSRGRHALSAGGHPKTPDGKPFFFAYNSLTSRCSATNYRFLHVCSKCFGKHPMSKCDGSGTAAASSAAK